MMLILSAIAGYLLGSVNTSLVLGKLFYKKDVRQYGSGNAGATNTLRTLGKSPQLWLWPVTFEGSTRLSDREMAGR